MSENLLESIYNYIEPIIREVRNSIKLMGEAVNIVENFKVDKVIFNCESYNCLENELIKVLDKKKIKYYSCIKELNISNNKLHF